MMPTEPLKDLSDPLVAEISRTFGALAPQALHFLQATGEPESIATLIGANPDPFAKLLTKVPNLMKDLAKDPGQLDLILSGNQPPAFSDLPLDALPVVVAERYRAGRIGILGSWAIGGDFDPHERLALLAEELLLHVHRRLQLSLSVLALGSLATRDLAPNSNLNLLLVAESDDLQRNDLETHAFLGFFQGLRHYGFDTDVEIQRIQGRLFVPRGGLSGLAVSSLSPEEFVALSLTRLLIGDPERAVEPTPMTPERLRTLVAHKKRLETELVPIRYRRRNVKFGEGGLADIEWLLMLNEARFPTATDRLRPGPLGSTPSPLWRIEERIGKLAEAQLLTIMERDELLAAHRHGMEVRLRLFLLDLHPDVIPENPDKLLRLAETMGFAVANEFLRAHEEHLDAIRSIYLDSLERLRA